jgi:hypothetical protein
MSDTFNTTKVNWQGVDDIPTAGSDNLVKSGGVYESFLLEYCINACNGFVPNLSQFTNLAGEEGAWTAGLLRANGEIDQIGGNYKTSMFIDYNAPYGQPYSVVYADMGNQQYSPPYVQVAFYKKSDHSLVKAYPCVPYKRLILIPRGYSVRVTSSVSSATPSLYYSNDATEITNLEEYINNYISNINSSIANLNNSIANLNNSIDSIDATLDELTAGKTEETETETTTVSPDTDKIKVYNNEIWASNGTLVEGGGFNTFRLLIPQGAKSVNLSNYSYDVYNGGFFTEQEEWIKGINNTIDDMSSVNIPNNTHYLDVTYAVSHGYTATVIYTIEKTTYTLPALVINPQQIIGNVMPNNQWYGKKVVWIGTSVPYGSNTFNYESYASYAARKLGFNIVPAVIPGEAIHAKLEDGVIKPLTYGSTVLSKEEYQNLGWTVPNSPLAPWMPGSENNTEHPGTGYNGYYRTWENVFNSENADADLYVFDVAPNNTNFDETDWNMFDYEHWRYTDDSDFSEHRTTFIGAILFLMDKMYEVNPNARMVFVLGSGFAYYSAKQNMQKISEKWGIPIIDIWGKVNTNPKSLKVIKSKNGTDSHPSDFGHEILGNMITNELLLIS